MASVGMLSSTSWMVAVEKREAVGDQPSGVDIPQKVQTSGKAEAWAKACGFAMYGPSFSWLHRNAEVYRNAGVYPQ